jgi:CxxC-x17-CxxC domain-containing protein
MAKFERNSSDKPRRRDSGRSYGGRDSGRSDRRDSGRSYGRRESFGGRDSGGFRGGSDRRSSRPAERTQVICDACKKQCEVPFKPTSDKPIYCDDCFRQNSGSRSSGGSSKGLAEINEKLDKIMKALNL